MSTRFTSLDPGAAAITSMTLDNKISKYTTPIWVVLAIMAILIIIIAIFAFIAFFDTKDDKNKNNNC